MYVYILYAHITSNFTNISLISISKNISNIKHDNHTSSLLHILHIKTSRGYTYGPFSTLMERIFLKSLSSMFWHSNVNSQLLPWKYSSSNTVILNFPLCSNCSCGFMAAVDHRTLYQEKTTA